MQEFFYPELDSSQEKAKQLISMGEITQNSLVYCDSQTAGRGQRGKSWISPAGAGIYASFVFPCDKSPTLFIENPSSLTIKSAEIVRDELKRLTNIDFEMRGINDIYYDDKKLAGILCEIYQKRFVICGYGINLLACTRELPAGEDNKSPISLEEIKPELLSSKGLDKFKQSLMSSVAAKLSTYYSSVV